MKTYSNKQQYFANIEKVWQIITNTADYAWRSNVSDVSAIANGYQEMSADTGYATSYSNIIDTKPIQRQMNLQHVDGEGWRKFILEADSQSLTTLTIVESFDSHAGRLVQPLIDRFFEKQQRTYLSDLQRVLG